jgi:2-desacetyl-2-hydroxyethyl bacteriochlorophyllide A dehydrogenase
MKAMILRAPLNLRFEEVERPRPRPGEVFIRVTHSGVCGTDLRIYDGSVPVRHPLIMGHEMCGEVVDFGGDTIGDDRIQIGDRVIVDPSLSCGVCINCQAGQTNLCRNGGLVGRDSNGGFAEYLLAPLSHVFPLPSEVDSQKAPLIQVLTTCIHAQRFLNIFPGQSVVVVGLGVTGQLHLQLVKSRGANPVIGVTRSAWKRQLAKEFGADLTLCSGAEGSRGVSEATNGQGADVVIVATGSLSTIAEAISMCRPGATLQLFGMTTATEGKLPFYQLYYKELTIFNSRAATAEDFPVAVDLVARGVVKLNSLVTHILPLAELSSAIEMLETDEDYRMKIILKHI